MPFSRMLRCEALEDRTLLSTSYYVSSSAGNDTHDGKGPVWDGTHGPWQTIAKVEGVSFAPGDSILFKRGDAWRELLKHPCSGTAAGRITYGAYGDASLPKPLLLGSVDRSDPAYWVYTGSDNIWYSSNVDQVTTSGSELLSNPSFDSNTSNWYRQTNSPAAASFARTATPGEYDSSPGGGKLSVTNHGSSPDDIWLYNYSGSANVTAGQDYLLTFKAKVMGGSSFTVPEVRCFLGGKWYSAAASSDLTVTGNWATYKVLFQPTNSSSYAYVVFSLGGAGGVPAGANFCLDTLSFKACAPTDGQRLPEGTVGNIIINNGVGANPCLGYHRGQGTLAPSLAALTQPGDFYFDINYETLGTLYVRTSGGNPASQWSDIELATGGAIIQCGDNNGGIGGAGWSASYMTFEDLELRNGDFHGLQVYGQINNGAGAPTNDITIRGCDFSFIGGADMWHMDTWTRGGECIDVWCGTSNLLIENNRMWQAYDSGVSFQANFEVASVHDVVIRNNIIWDCSQGFDDSNSYAGSSTYNFYVENNTIVDSGMGWPSLQPDTGDIDLLRGRNLSFIGGNLATVSNFYVRNNILAEAGTGPYGANLMLGATWHNLANLTLDNNLYYQPDYTNNPNPGVVYWNPTDDWNQGAYYDVLGTVWAGNSFAKYQSDTGKDLHSIAITTPSDLSSIFVDRRTMITICAPVRERSMPAPRPISRCLRTSAGSPGRRARLTTWALTNISPCP
jgi:hypothetical protein